MLLLSKMDIKVQYNNRNQLHIANHVLNTMSKKIKLLQLSPSQMVYIIDNKNDNKFFLCKFRWGNKYFRILVCELIDNFELTSTKYIGVDGSVRIFLYMIWQPCSHRNSHERFYYFGETVHKNFNKVLRSI